MCLILFFLSDVIFYFCYCSSSKSSLKYDPLTSTLIVSSSSPSRLVVELKIDYDYPSQPWAGIDVVSISADTTVISEQLQTQLKVSPSIHPFRHPWYSFPRWNWLLSILYLILSSLLLNWYQEELNKAPNAHSLTSTIQTIKDMAGRT